MEEIQDDSGLNWRPFGGWPLKYHLYLLSFVLGATLTIIGVATWITEGFSYSCLKYFAGIFLLAWPFEALHLSTKRALKRDKDVKKLNEVFDTPEKKLDGKREKPKTTETDIIVWCFAISFFVAILGLPVLLAGVLLEQIYNLECAETIKIIGLVLLLTFPAVIFFLLPFANFKDSIK